MISSENMSHITIVKIFTFGQKLKIHVIWHIFVFRGVTKIFSDWATFMNFVGSFVIIQEFQLDEIP